MIERCRGCGLMLTVPLRSDEELMALYEASYFDEWLETRPRDGGGLQARLADHEPRAVLVSSLRPPGRLLDVGAATGLFLETARRYGWEVAAVEPNADAWRAAQEQFGFPVAAISLGNVERGDGFDAVCFWHSLEHHADPAAALRVARNLLRPGGLLLVECPNAGSLDRRVAGTRWDGWHLPWHTVHLTPATLEALTARSGFEVLEIRRALWRPLAEAGRGLRNLGQRARRREPALPGIAPAMPFLFRHAASSPPGRLAKVLSGRDMLLIAARA
jgi:SAM-dependent methyltransferase